MDTETRVLHDFDSPLLSGRYALNRGLKLVVFALSKKLPFLRPIVRDVYTECYEYCLTLARLDKLAGVKSIFGLRKEVEDEFPDLKRKLEGMGFSVHRHTHLSKTNVMWDPPLAVDPKYWFFDQRYAAGEVKPEERTEWAVFHADYPYLVNHYASFLEESVSRGLLGSHQRLS